MDKYDPGNWSPVSVPCGKTDEEFDNAVLKSAYNETVKERGTPYHFSGESNSNQFVYQIITGAGGQVPGGVDRGFRFGAPDIYGR